MVCDCVWGRGCIPLYALNVDCHWICFFHNSSCTLVTVTWDCRVIYQLLWNGQTWHWINWVMICAIRRLALTVSDVCWRLICSRSTSTYSALEVSHFMRYTNLWLTYLLTYWDVFLGTSEINVHRWLICLVLCTYLLMYL